MVGNVRGMFCRAFTRVVFVFEAVKGGKGERFGEIEVVKS